MNPIYIYPISGNVDALQAEARSLGDGLLFWSADAAQLRFAAGTPDLWREQGALFSDRGELRWQRQDGGYSGLLILDQPLSGREAQPGWSAEETQFSLRDLELSTAARARLDQADPPVLKARLLYYQDQAAFISPRTRGKER